MSECVKLYAALTGLRADDILVKKCLQQVCLLTKTQTKERIRFEKLKNKTHRLHPLVFVKVLPTLKRRVSVVSTQSRLKNFTQIRIDKNG